MLLVSDTKSEINRRVLALPVTEHVEIPLPSATERAHFVTQYGAVCTPPDAALQFELSREAFVEDTAGLKLTSLEDLLETSRRTGEPVRRKDVLAEVNLILEAELGDVVKVNMPSHSPKDIIGSEATTAILHNIFQRCDNPDTAVSAVLVSGPNGGGKTFQMEAFAAESGRIVIELTGLRGMWYGQTDKLFERLRWHIATYGKVLILVDEAHTAFGSVHQSDTHETERRLAGNIIKMMGDPRFRGKVLWALMTSRPDELDPDVKSRAPLQIPIFDPEGEARQRFIQELFQRRGIALSPEELQHAFQQTAHYSARDFDNLVREVRAQGKPVGEVLQIWQASTAIVQQRRLQTLIAALHCSYPQLLPEWLRSMSEVGGMEGRGAHITSMRVRVLRGIYFGAGLPRISDGQFLFLQHMLSHMQPREEGGSRVAIIMNGSPLFTGDAGSGESEIRRWILEHDWLEALVALPEQLIYNTGIATYVWVLTNRGIEVAERW